MAPIQRRAVVLLAVALCGVIWFIASPSTPSTQSFSNYFDVRGTTSVPEIYGLIHLILETSEGEGTMASPEMVGLDSFTGSKGKKIDWRRERDRINGEYPVIVFSKVRRFPPFFMTVFLKSFVLQSYCPYSKKLKSLFLPSMSKSSPQDPNQQPKLVPPPYILHPAPLVIEVDQRPDTLAIKHLLTRLTGRGTFPNMVVLGESIGGSDEVGGMHQRGELEEWLAAKDLFG